MLEQERVSSLSEVGVFEAVLDNLIVCFGGTLSIELELHVVNREHLAMCSAIVGLILIAEIVQL